MNKLLTYVIVILIIILDDNLLALVGYPHNDSNANAIFKIHPLAYISIVTFISLILSGRIKPTTLLEYCKVEIYISILCLSLFIYLYIMNRFDSVSFIVDALLTPAFVSILLKHTSIIQLVSFKKLIFTVFFFNFCLALFEKTTNYPVLSKDFIGFAEFRSTALYGHPLNNALIMSVLGIFLYLTSEKFLTKLFIILSTIISLLCFGARGGILGIVGGVLLDVLIIFFRKNTVHGFKYLIGIAIVFFTGFFLLISTSLGDRILSTGSFETDESALERVRTIKLLELMKPDQLEWGMSTISTEVLMRKGGVTIMENYFIVWITKFGVFISLLLLFLLLRLVVKQIRYFDKQALLPILFTFLFVASINNSLATKTRVISVLVLCCFILKRYDLYTFHTKKIQVIENIK